MQLHIQRYSGAELPLSIPTDGSKRADYVYMYPPRQAYAPLTDVAVEPLVERSLRRSGSLNLYVHVPFCEQICSFCNLYALGTGNDFDDYVALVEREIDSYGSRLRGKRVETIYIGGGTPSLLPVALLERLCRALERASGMSISDVKEVALEVSPASVTVDKCWALRNIGINRVNLGVQSFADQEFASVGRRHDTQVSRSALEILLSAGFGNVCVDLIYGLPNQSFDSWLYSVRSAINSGAETICIYPLTLRAYTGLSIRGMKPLESRAQLRKFQQADACLRDAGYSRETHVRYIRSAAGGYLQKANHWSLQNVLGFGAGARSYLWEADLRNGYSVRRRRSVLESYARKVNAGRSPFVDGYLMSDDERRRKAIVLGLHNLDRAWYRGLFAQEPEQAFGSILAWLEDRQLLSRDGERIRLTELGMQNRDLIVQLFFSETVQQRLSVFDYDE